MGSLLSWLPSRHAVGCGAACSGLHVSAFNLHQAETLISLWLRWLPKLGLGLLGTICTKDLPGRCSHLSRAAGCALTPDLTLRLHVGHTAADFGNCLQVDMLPPISPLFTNHRRERNKAENHAARPAHMSNPTIFIPSAACRWSCCCCRTLPSPASWKPPRSYAPTSSCSTTAPCQPPQRSRYSICFPCFYGC